MNRIVRTRLVTAGSAGSGEPHSSFVEADPSVADGDLMPKRDITARVPSDPRTN